MTHALSRVLSEPVMGFLALAALTTGVAPLLFALPHGVGAALDVAEWAIVAVFALEYLVHLSLADSRFRYLIDPWRILDALIILAPLASVLPWTPESLRSSPALRVLRLFRLVLFGARVRHGLSRSAAWRTPAVPSGPPVASALSPSSSSPRSATWEEVLRWSSAPTGEWMHASNLDAARVGEIAAAVGLPHVMLEAALDQTSYPRLESTSKWCALMLPLPGPKGGRSAVLALVSERQLLTLSLNRLDLHSVPAQPQEAMPWGPRCVLHLVRQVLERNEQLAGRLEQEIRQLEDLPADQSTQGFFRSTFGLKRALALAKGDLWRLRGLLEMLADGRRDLPGLGAARTECTELAEEADYLYETIDKMQESLLALLDLHLNMASYDVNRFMRVLAIVSCLALIPTIVGGLLGMNLEGNPWPVTLSQVGFVTFVLMLGVLYAFLAKGWLR